MKPKRYKLPPLPGLEQAAAAKEWNPDAKPQERPSQGWLPFSDGGQLGPLFNTAEEVQP